MKPNNGLIAFFIALALIAVYAYTMPRSITLGDAGLFQMVCHLGGISHPPGYPLFTTICQAVVPAFGPGVMAGNLLSAVFATLACVLLFYCIFETTGHRVSSIVGALGYGLSQTFWSQAIIIEVYTLAVLFFVLCWWLLLCFKRSGRLSLLFAATFVFGLSLSNHWPLMLLSTPALVMTLMPFDNRLIEVLKKPQNYLLGFLCLSLGLLPYLTLFQKDPAIAVIGPVTNITELYHYIARTVYGDIDDQAIATIQDRLKFMPWLLKESAEQLGWIGSILVLCGIWASFRVYSRWLAIQLVLLFLGSTFILNLLLNFSYDHNYRAVFEPYPVIAYLSLAVWLAMGFAYLIDKADAHQRSTPIAIVLVFIIAAPNFAENDRHADHWLSTYGQSLLQTLPDNSIYFANDDYETSVLGYLHKVEGVRPDLEFRSLVNQFFDNRLALPTVDVDEQVALVGAFVDNTDKTIIGTTATLSPRESHGAFFRFTPREQPRAVYNPNTVPLLDYVLDLYLREAVKEPTELNFLYHRMIDFTRQYVWLRLQGEPFSAEDQLRIDQLQTTFPGKLATLEILLPISRSNAKPFLTEMAVSAERQLPDFAPRQSRALIYEYLGRIALIAPADRNRAEAMFKQSLGILPSGGNTALCPLLTIFSETGRHHLAEVWADRFPEAHCGPG